MLQLHSALKAAASLRGVRLNGAFERLEQRGLVGWTRDVG